MTGLQLILSRCFLLTFGRIPAVSALLKKILVSILVKRSEEKYVASSQYFDRVQFERAKRKQDTEQDA